MSALTLGLGLATSSLSVGFFAGGSLASAATARGRFFWISSWALGGLPNKSEAARVT